MKEEKTLKETVKEIWEKERGIKSAFYNASQMFLMLSQKEEEEDGYDEYKENPYLDMLWGGIVGVLSASAVNEYAELELNYDGKSVWVYVSDEVNKEYIIVDRFNRGDKWVDVYKNGTAQYWEMSRY